MKGNRKMKIAGTVVMIVLAVVLIPVLIVNLTLIIKGNINKDVPPDIFGVAPMAVTSGSMEGSKKDSFKKGALVFIKLLDEDEKQSLDLGDIVCFRVEESGSISYVTHRIIAFNYSEGQISAVVTQGDANTANDGSIALENVIGKCIGSIAGLGGFAVFLQTPVGIVVIVGIPVLCYIVYDVIRITLYNKRVKAENAAAEREGELSEKDEEIRRLRALLEGGAASEAQGGDPPPPQEQQEPQAEPQEQQAEQSAPDEE